MRITDIKAYPLWIAARNLLVIKVETDAGIYGLGESGLSSREQAVIVALRH
jgi:galactonate dehydratase